jgi:hypothetical protein
MACMKRPVPMPAKDLTEAQLDGYACIRCGAEQSDQRPVEAWRELGNQVFESVNARAYAARRIEGDH